MRRNTPKTQVQKWYYQIVVEYPDGTQEINQSVTYSKTHAGAVRTLEKAARNCAVKIRQMKISINPIKE